MTDARDVFGVNTRKNVLSYVERGVDQDFKDALSTDEYAVVVVYGTSKQGKSSLCRHILPREFCTFVAGASDTTFEALNREVLAANGVSEKADASEEQEKSWQTSGEIAVPEWLSTLISLPAKVGASRNSHSKSVTSRSFVGINFSNAASVARIYAEAVGRKPIVIDNFHYFDREEQRKIATGIRAFEEEGIKIVILGTWLEANYLTHLNSDLSGRVRSLSIEEWTNEDFLRVLAAGEEVLNVQFGSRAREALISKAAGNIGLLQKALSRVVRAEGVSKTCDRKTAIGAPAVVNEAFRRIAEEQFDDTFGQLKIIGELGQTQKPFNGRTRMHYLLRAFVAEQDSGARRGVPSGRLTVRANELISRMRGKEHFDANNLGAVRRLLGAELLAHQRKHLSTPILFFDADADALRVTDSWVLLTLRNERARLVEKFEDGDSDL